MDKQRMIDANHIVEVAERAWDAWNLAMATQDTNRGVNKVIKRQELCKAVKAVAEDAPTIDPETLPVVQRLRAELARAKTERDALLKEFAGECGMCAHYEDCIKNHHSCCDGAEWEWRGPKEVLNNG